MPEVWLGTPSPACPIGDLGITALTEGPAVGAELAWGGAAGGRPWCGDIWPGPSRGSERGQVSTLISQALEKGRRPQ